MEKIIKVMQRAVLAVAIVLLTSAPYSYATAVTNAHIVSIVVNPSISMSSNSDFTLTFPDYIKDTLSDTKTITYDVKANNVTKNAGAVSASLSALFPNVSLKAAPGTYASVSGSGTLTPTAGGTVTVAGIALMDHSTVTGSGKTIRGSFPVIYQAQADADLDPATDSLSRTLTVTLADT